MAAVASLVAAVPAAAAHDATPAGMPGPHIVPAAEATPGPAIGGLVHAGGTTTWVQQLRDVALRRGEGPAVVGATEVPARLARGNAFTLAVTDLDGDGRDELVQARGTAAFPALAVVDGATGAVRWKENQPAPFAVALVPDGTSQDALVFVDDAVQRIDLVSGARTWKRALPAGDQIFYWGPSPAPGGGDFVLGAVRSPTLDSPQFFHLDLEFRALADGSARGRRTVDGEGLPPSAALAGDLDGDGIGDLFTFAPLYAFGAAGAGTVQAVTGRGGTVRWSRAFAVPANDTSFLVTATDVTGDGTRDPVLLSEFLGADGGTRTSANLSVVDGTGGGPAAGLDPAVSVDLAFLADDLIVPGDLNGDGGQDIVVSAAGIRNGSESVIVFEAVGKPGRLWLSVPAYPSGGSFYGGWWSRAGDIDGDGIDDALVLLGSPAAGVDRAVAISQRAGTTRWVHDRLAGRFVLPAFADADGDGADDVVDAFSVEYPTSSTTRMSFVLASGRDRSARWPYARLLNIGRGVGGLVTADGGRLTGGATDEILVAFNTYAGRHFSEALDGASGSVVWTSSP